MARLKNDNLYLNPFQKISFRDDAGLEAASMYFDGDVVVLDGITISGAQGPQGEAGTGVPGFYIGDEDGNSTVSIEYDMITLRTAGTNHIRVSAGGNTLIGHDDISTAYGKLNIDHTGSNTLVLDNIDTSANSPGLFFRKSRGERGDFYQTSVIGNDRLGEIVWYGFGTGPLSENKAWVPAFSMTVTALGGTITSTSVPAELTFRATADTWDNAQTVLSLSAGGIALANGPSVNYIAETIEPGGFNCIPTSNAVYLAMYGLEAQISDIYTTFSGIDLKMSRIFDPTYSGTEIRLVDDKIEFLSQGTKIGGINEEGLFELGPEGLGIIGWYNGDLHLEASSLKVPTASAVKLYVDNYGSSNARLTGNGLTTESELSYFTLADSSWTGYMEGMPLIKAWTKYHFSGSMFGKKTHHFWVGDKCDVAPIWNYNTPDSGIPAMFVHSKGGSRLFLYNEQTYGADTNPYAQNPGITINKIGCAANEEIGSIIFGGPHATMSVTVGNKQNLPVTENTMTISLGNYGAYNGSIVPTDPYNNTYTGVYPGGMLVLNCKLHFGHNRVWGTEAGGYGTVPYTNPHQNDWGSYGNNGWVNRIASCHAQGTRETAGGTLWDQPPEFWTNTGDDDHCLVTGKYVHTLIRQSAELWEGKLTTNYLLASSAYTNQILPFTGTEHRVGVGEGVTLTYGYENEYDRALILKSGHYDIYGHTKTQAAAYFTCAEPGQGNRVIIESSAQASTSDTDALYGYHSTAPSLQFFRSRFGAKAVNFGGSEGGGGYQGGPARGGNIIPVKSGDILGEICFMGQALNNGVNNNPCDNYSAYRKSAAIRVFATDVLTSTCHANMAFYTSGGGASSAEDMSRTMALSGGSVWISNDTYYGAGYLGSLGTLYVKGKGFTKQQLSGDIVINKGSGPAIDGTASILFNGTFLTTIHGDPNSSDVYTRACYAGSTLGGRETTPWARIDAGVHDYYDGAGNSGRLSFLIHRHQAIVLDEIMRIDGAGKVIVGSDLVGQTAHMTSPPSLFNIAQTADNWTGGLTLISTAGLKNCIYTTAAGTLVVAADQYVAGGILALNPGNGKVELGNTVNNTASEYILRTNGNIVPAINNMYNLGSSSLKWNDIWATNSIIQTSDKNEKEEILSEKLGLNFVKQLKPVSFKRTGGKRRHHGLIAQDVEYLIKKLGVPTDDAAFFVKDAGGAYGLRYEELIGILIKAVQELAAKVEA